MTELRKEISSVFNMTRFLCNSLEHSLEKAFTLEEIHKFKRVVMTGCGDSLCASMAAKECFEELTGRMVDVPTCINLARHYDARRFGEPGETLVVLVSFSGKVSRVVEAAQRARRLGAVTVGVTHDAASPVAAACDRVLVVQPDEFPLKRTPGCRTYMASTIALYYLASYMAKSDGKENAVSEMRALIEKNTNDWEAAFPAIDERLYAAADAWKNAPYYEFLSAGPEFASAWFGQAKIYEAAGIFSRYENLEDWAHVDYILHGMDASMFIFASPENASYSRAQEVESVLRRQHYKYLFVTDKADEKIDAASTLLIPKADKVWLYPLYQTLVPCTYGDHLQQLKGTSYFCCDMIETYFPFGGSILRTSEINASF